MACKARVLPCLPESTLKVKKVLKVPKVPKALKALKAVNPKAAKDNPPRCMKYLVVGLGNPGADSEETWTANIGFKVVDSLAQRLSGTFETGRLGECPPSDLREGTSCFSSPPRS